ncbi:MAG: maleylacetoacetate isomerase [Betaproteobacteria bacterium]|nr:MAG: maleylacetoacetate isomerase [Betaproteobacteria bacterium]
MKLYNYFRSSAAYRVRIALNLKGLAWEHVGVHLVKGEQRSTDYLSINPAGLIPALIDDSAVLTQSLAIIEYLDEKYPETLPLLPGSIETRAQVRAASLALACDVHPLGNVRVLKYLTSELGLSEAQKEAWLKHWIGLGLTAFEASLAQSASHRVFCFGDAPTMADCVLVPQVFSARRFNVDMTAYPRIVAVDAHCNSLAAFQSAHPTKQPDFQA